MQLKQKKNNYTTLYNIKKETVRLLTVLAYAAVQVKK